MEKLDKTKVKVLEKTSNGESSKTAGTNAASTEVRLSVSTFIALLFALSLLHIRSDIGFPPIVAFTNLV